MVWKYARKIPTPFGAHYDPRTGSTAAPDPPTHIPLSAGLFFMGSSPSFVGERPRPLLLHIPPHPLGRTMKPSPTRLQLYQTCPRRLYLATHSPRPVPETPLFGTQAHAAFEDLLRGRELSTQQHPPQAILRARQAYELVSPYLDPTEPVEPEYTLEYRGLRCRLDALTKDSRGRTLVIDLKTTSQPSSRAPDDQTHAYDIQRVSYALAAAEHTQSTVVRTMWVYVPSKAGNSAPRVLDRIDSKENLEQIFDKHIVPLIQPTADVLNDANTPPPSLYQTHGAFPPPPQCYMYPPVACPHSVECAAIDGRRDPFEDEPL